MSNREQTRKLVVLALLAGVSVVLVYFIRIPLIPLVPFLEYDPADIPIFIGALAYGPLAGVLLTVVVSVVQGLTVSAATGGLFYGIIMHIIATSTMVMVVCSVYRIRHTKSGAVLGLFLATLARGLVMLPANHFITPLFMGQPVEVVDSLLLPGILPFNPLVGTINSTVTFLVYKTVSRHVIHGEGWSKKSAPAESEA